MEPKVTRLCVEMLRGLGRYIEDPNNVDPEEWEEPWSEICLLIDCCSICPLAVIDSASTRGCMTDIAETFRAIVYEELEEKTNTDVAGTFRDQIRRSTRDAGIVTAHPPEIVIADRQDLVWIHTATEAPEAWQLIDDQGDPVADVSQADAAGDGWAVGVNLGVRFPWGNGQFRLDKAKRFAARCAVHSFALRALWDEIEEAAEDAEQERAMAKAGGG